MFKIGDVVLFNGFTGIISTNPENECVVVSDGYLDGELPYYVKKNIVETVTEHKIVHKYKLLMHHNSLKSRCRNWVNFI